MKPLPQTKEQAITRERIRIMRGAASRAARGKWGVGGLPARIKPKKITLAAVRGI